MNYVPGEPHPESSGNGVHAKYHAKTELCQEEGGWGGGRQGREEEAEVTQGAVLAKSLCLPDITKPSWETKLTV